MVTDLETKMGDYVYNIKLMAVIDLFFGDGGKGKWSDAFSPYFDWIVKYNGGNNSGHTRVSKDGLIEISHALPGSFPNIKHGKKVVLGNGVLISADPDHGLIQELDYWNSQNLDYHNSFFISDEAHITMPFHVEEDKRANASQKKGGIVSTIEAKNSSIV